MAQPHMSHKINHTGHGRGRRGSKLVPGNHRMAFGGKRRGGRK